MRIKRIIHQYRRDFEAEYECEYCGYTGTKSGYDDENFHRNVVPNMICPKCGKKASPDYRPLTTKYPEYMEI